MPARGGAGEAWALLLDPCSVPGFFRSSCAQLAKAKSRWPRWNFFCQKRSFGCFWVDPTLSAAGGPSLQCGSGLGEEPAGL